MKIYTKVGDQGYTFMGDGVRIEKSSQLMHSIGTLDELNSQLGLILATAREKKFFLEKPLVFEDWILSVQNDLFVLGSELSQSKGIKKIMLSDFNERIYWAEESIDLLTDALAPLKNFILPGGSVIAAQVHVARTITRRAERHLSAVLLTGTDDLSSLRYINRLSDAFFQWARMVNHAYNIEDTLWNLRKKDKE